MFAEWFSAKTLAPPAINTATFVVNSLRTPAGRAIEEMKVRLEIGFDLYIRQQIERYSAVKTILGVNYPLDIRDIYVICTFLETPLPTYKRATSPTHEEVMFETMILSQ